MTTFRTLCLAGSFSVAVMGLATTAGAQTNDEIFPNLQWNFATPGARASGMGKTFIGQADDASAAVTNPAGLMSLTRPQVYAEYKNTRLRAERLAAADAFTTRQPTATETNINALSFASFSIPINTRLAVGFSIHRFLDYEEDVDLAPRPVPNATNSILFPLVGSADFSGTAFGGSAAYMVTEALRVGVTVAGNRFDAKSKATRSGFLNGVTAPAGIIVNETTIDDSQMAASATVGVLYRVVNDKVSVGFTYTKSPRFTTTENLRVNPGLDLTPKVNQPLIQAESTPPFPRAVEINVPDHFGFGVAVRPTTKLLVAVDAVRIKYSSLSDNTTAIFNATIVSNTDYRTPDVTEVHAGAEYIVGNVMGSPLLVRGGVLTNPSHLVSYTGTAGGSTSTTVLNAVAGQEAIYNLLPRKDDTRGTLGAGLVLGSRTQIDVAYVFGREFVASTAVRF